MKRINFYIMMFLLLAFTSCSEDGDNSSVGDNTSIGGSLASFVIRDNTLFTINDDALVSYDISNAGSGITEESNYIANKSGARLISLETIFPYNNYLFLGAQDGMHIIDVSSAKSPKYISSYEHVTSCDPVVVQGNYAYVTLREGSNCSWRAVNELHVIDISDLTNPTEVKSLSMDRPEGLGVDGDLLFVCDNEKLKVFNNANPSELEFLEIHNNITAKDVIPYNNILMVMGNGELSQYNYSSGKLEFLSKISTQKK